MKLSSRFQVVIPRPICESMRIKPGDEVEIMEFDGSVFIVPLWQLPEMKRRLKNMKTPGKDGKKRP